jgi:hypothetical protein
MQQTGSLRYGAQLFMTKTTQAIIVGAVTAAAILTTQVIWHHYRSGGAPQTDRRAHQPLSSQQSAEAKQAARDFFGAFKDGDWDAVAKYWPANAPKGKSFNDIFTDRVKDAVNGLEIVSIGTPYKEGSVTLVPYEVQLKGGDSQKNNLRLVKDRDGQWHWLGGF